MNAPRRLIEDDECSNELRAWLSRASASPAIPPSVGSRLAAYSAHLVAGGIATAALGTGAAEAASAGAGSSSVGIAEAGAGSSSVGTKVILSFSSATLGTKTAIISVLFSSMVGFGYVASAPLFIHRSAVGASQVQSSPSSEATVLRQTRSRSVEAARVSPEAQNHAAAQEPTSSTRSSPRTTGTATSRITEPLPGQEDDSGALSGEARVLEAARASLGSAPDRALSLTEEHARHFPRGQLGAEREFIAIDALIRLGRRAEAWERARPGLEGAPDSLYAKRLRTLLGEPAP
ncbi:MAG: hypothetical protein QM784_34480 [Polyangiaceae bacterium]